MKVQMMAKIPQLLPILEGLLQVSREGLSAESLTEQWELEL